MERFEDRESEIHTQLIFLNMLSNKIDVLTDLVKNWNREIKSEIPLDKPD